MPRLGGLLVEEARADYIIHLHPVQVGLLVDCTVRISLNRWGADAQRRC